MRLKIFTNQLDGSECTERDYECLLSEWMRIREQYPQARLYRDTVSVQTDVTPKTKDEAMRLLEACGDYVVLCHAYDFGSLTWAIIGAVLSIGTTVYAYLHMPKLGGLNQADTGPGNNNSLASRQNSQRVGQRVPDIYGRVKSIPDLIAPVYRYYEGNIQVEECLLCIGTGHFEITNIRESETPIDTISGAACSIYAPDTWLTSPTPQIQIGQPFTELPLVTKQVSAVDGKQNILAPNTGGVSVCNVSFSGNTINIGAYFYTENPYWDATSQQWLGPGAHTPNLTEYFQVGELVNIYGAEYPNFDLNGTYTIASLTPTSLTLLNPSQVNSGWARLGELTSAEIIALKKNVLGLTGGTENYVGWFYAGSELSTGMILNFTAPGGIYYQSSARQVDLLVEYQQVSDGQPTGPISQATVTLNGQDYSRARVSKTLRTPLGFTGQFRFRVKRNNDNGKSANLVDDVIFESAYSYYYSHRGAYPLDTVVRLKRLAIGSGTNASELNMTVTRKLYHYRNGVRSAVREATTSFADSLIAMALDEYIGRMPLNHIDLLGIYATETAICDYFGSFIVANFCYTFDDAKASYQEMAFALAEAVFCTARRENGLHFVEFERKTDYSTVLFNHRNTKPETLTVTESFGIDGDYDGIELKWCNQQEGFAESVIKLPDAYQSNYKTIESVGVTNKAQAHLLAHRAWNKLRYNRKTIEFTAYGEADIVTRNDRIAVVDSTLPIFYSGQVEAQNGLAVTLDYPVTLDAATNYVIHLQLKSGIVDVIAITATSDAYVVQLSRPPSMPLVTDGVAHATYEITPVTKAASNAYLLFEKRSNGTFESTITAMQYDERYYQNDADFKSGLI